METNPTWEPWNKGKLVGQKPPLKPKDIWAIRIHLQNEHQVRDLAMFNLAIDSKLRGCDLVNLHVRDVTHGNQILPRAMVVQRKTQRPVQFELTELTRSAVSAWVEKAKLRPDHYLFPSRLAKSPHVSTRQYARIVHQWVAAIGLDSTVYGTHTMRRTKATLIYKRTKIHPEDQRTVFACVEKLFADPEAKLDIEYRKIRKDGSVFWVHQRASLEPGSNAQRLLVICRDITEKRYLEDKLAHQASHDMLTNLMNRREFERRFQQLLERACDPADQHYLCFFDLDQFKTINDTCGHMAGDELLRQIAALLKGLVRSRDTLARIGGDEFAVLMEHASLEKAHLLAEKIRAAIEEFEFQWRSQRFSIGVSVGIVPVQVEQSITELLNMADMACYTANKQGKNRVHTTHSEVVAPE